jgi:hypothetical protein
VHRTLYGSFLDTRCSALDGLRRCGSRSVTHEHEKTRRLPRTDGSARPVEIDPTQIEMSMQQFSSYDDYVQHKARQRELAEARQWHVVNAEAVWPEVRFARETDRRDQRIIVDPDGEHVLYPPDDPDARKRLEWVLVVRDLQVRGRNGHEYIHIGAYPSFEMALEVADSPRFRL